MPLPELFCREMGSEAVAADAREVRAGDHSGEVPAAVRPAVAAAAMKVRLETMYSS